MRENNIYWKDYRDYLEEHKITVEDEYNDILNLIKDKEGWYDDFKVRLVRWWNNKDKEYIPKEAYLPSEKRRKINTHDEIITLICMPIYYMDEVAPRKVQYGFEGELTEEQKAELKLLHWLYLEMETIRDRLSGG